MIISAIFAIVILYTLNLEKLRVLSPYIVYLTILLLIIVLVKGNTVKGATRQINLGFINFQPSVLARLALIFYFAHILDKKNEELVSSTTGSFLGNFFALIVVTGVTFPVKLLWNGI
jgi:cell division protein FtsW (lipid II flippase)